MRRLRLRAEALSELTSDELHAIAAGDDTVTTVPTRPAYSCVVRCVLESRLPNCTATTCIEP